ncbi:helix-turn-helix transcriptional regulator [Dactylosporangium vinaceum]|uniref:histidine kinase n=1 Tax=Dactylosporangium vinaceum TaxID=53362 RepID=A0ABV5MR44_9ACTN|nr:response regulator transcription factor family protein [Dactylosporangium vinaceum]
MRHLDALGVALAVVCAAPLAVRHRLPALGFAVSAAASVALLHLGYPLDAPVAAAAAAYTVARVYSGAPARPRWCALAAVHAFVPAVAAAYASIGVRVWDISTELLAWAAVFAGLWIAGDRTRLRALRLAEAQADVERERRLAAADERTRIDRELHDSAGHAINVILVQAGAARLLQDRDPERARQALSTVERVARDTITDIDRMVRALRDDHPDRDEPADPDALRELIKRHRGSGLHIAAELPERIAPLPRSVAWAACRILQEALTNAARHGAGTAAVAVRAAPGHLEIDVTNPCAAPRARREGGHGIVGMRERATLTTFEDDDYVLSALRAGAAGFVLKRIQPEQLIADIHTVAAGESLLAPQVTRTVIEHLTDVTRTDPGRLAPLTPRERDVLTLIAQGLSNGDIAAALRIEDSTVKTHVKRILAKLHLRDRVHAVIVAYETGLVRVGRP